MSTKPIQVEGLISPQYHGFLPMELQTLPLTSAPTVGCNVHDIYGDILTDLGVRKWIELNDRFLAGDIKKTYSSWHLQSCKSGSWIRDPKLSAPPGLSLQGILNTYSNRQVVGRFPDGIYKSDDQFVYSSVILFLGYGWCYTISGSLYGIPLENCNSEDLETSLPFINKLP